MNRSLSLHTPHGPLHGQLSVPPTAHALVLEVHAGSHHHDSPLTASLAGRGYGIFGLNLLTTQESQFPDTAHNVPQLTNRIIEALDFIHQDPDLQPLPIGLLSGGNATPAAIRAAAQRDNQVKAVACHGGIVDLAGLQALKFLASPLLMLTDRDDPATATAFQRAAPYLTTPHEHHVLGSAEDAGARVAAWFGIYVQ